MRMRDIITLIENAQQPDFKKDYCFVLALALNKLTGARMVVLTNKATDAMACIVARVSDDAFVDADGIRTKAEIFADSNIAPDDRAWKFESIDETRLNNWMRTGKLPRPTQEIEDAAEELARRLIGECGLGTNYQQ